MTETNEENFELLTLTLKTPESAADAAAVASMLSALVVLVERSREELNIEDEFTIRVNPFKAGSLEIPIQILVYGTAATLFTLNPSLIKLLDTMKTFFDLKKHFKGEPPSDEALHDGVSIGNIIINGDNNVINIIQDKKVDDAFDQAAQDLERDASLTGMKLINQSSGEELADISREEFPYFRIPGEREGGKISQDRIRVVEAVLTIRSPVLEGSAKWKFVHEGKQISASVKDAAFLDKVIKGVEAFRNGDRLKVELEIGEEFNATISDYERTNQYSITKVNEHIPRPSLLKQLNLLEPLENINQ